MNSDYEVFDPFNALMEYAKQKPQEQTEQTDEPQKVFLIYPDETRDITDRYAGHIDKPDGVTVIYTHSIVNGQRVQDRHTIHHINGRIIFKKGA